MRIKEFKRVIVGLPVFTVEQAARVWPNTDVKHLPIQLSRWVKSGELIRLKRSLYTWPEQEIDETLLANYLYQPSYVSLETVLNISGIMPDVSAEVTSVTTGRPTRQKTANGIFSYSKIARELYYGYHLVIGPDNSTLRIAYPEKALLDWIYIRRIKGLRDSRIEWNNLDKEELTKFAASYPQWVRKEIEPYVEH